MNRKTLLILVCFVLAGRIAAQELCTIQGKVSDQSNQPMPLVTVFIEGSADGAITNELGRYLLKTKQTGKIKLIATSMGYKKAVTELEVVPGSILNSDIIMEEKVTVLKEAVITASSFGSLSEKGIVMQKTDVLMTPGGAADVFQSVKTLPGLTQVSESAELYVRGGDALETVTIIDGAPVYHPFTMESSYGGLFSNVKTNFIKNMFFSSGGFSAKYGNALSGILEIETRGVPEGRMVNAGVSLANTSVSVDYPFLLNAAGLTVAYDRSITKPLFWLNGGADRFTLPPASENLTGSFTVNYSSTGKVKMLSVLASDEQGVEVERPEYAGVFNGTSHTTFNCLQWKDIYWRQVANQLSVSHNVYTNHWQLGNLDLEKTDAVLALRDDIGITLGAYSVIHTGLELEKRTVEYVGKVPQTDYDIRPNGSNKIIDVETGVNRYAVYLEYENARVLNQQNVSVSVGGRIDRIPDYNITTWNPRVNAGYKIDAEQKVLLAFGIFSQMPDVRLYNPHDGNPHLGPMKALHYIAAYQYNLENLLQFRLEAYYKKYQNLPLESTEQRYSNNGYGFARGIDVICKANPAEGLDGWISYGYIKSRRYWMDFSSETNAATDITHNFSFILKYALAPDWHTGINVKYATGRPYTAILGAVYNEDSKIWDPVEESTNAKRYPDYRRIDLRLTHFASIGNRIRAVVFFEGLNIFNLENIFGYSYSSDYKEKKTIKSYFGKRTLVAGVNLML